MRIALTGARGRVGRYVTNLALYAGHDVVAIDRSASTDEPHPHRRDIVIDVADYDALAAAFEGCDALIHLAAIPHPLNDPPNIVHNHNVTGSYNALHAAISKGIRRICQASSVNAIGLSFSRAPRYDYFPIDEAHPTYAEDPYGLSKWICELQADSLVRRYEDAHIASLRFHLVIESRDAARALGRDRVNEHAIKELFGYVRGDATADACLKSLTADFPGHEVFNIVGRNTTLDEPSLDLARRYYPDVEIRKPFNGNSGFFDTSKAERLLGWVHPSD